MSQSEAVKRLQKAQGLLQQEYTKDALKILTRLAEEFPETPGLNTTFGSALASVGQWRMASGYLKKALQNNLDQPDVLNNLAACHRALGKFREGLDNLEYALRLVPRFVDAWINKGNLHTDLGEPEKAALCYARAIKLKPADAGPWLSLIYSQLAAGSPSQALKVAQEACSRFPDDSAFITAEISALQAIGKPREALDKARQWEAASGNLDAAAWCLKAAQAMEDPESLAAEEHRLRDKYGPQEVFDAILSGTEQSTDQQQVS